MESPNKLRHRCRNPHCRLKLPAPVENEHHAFCTRGCHTRFYRTRCLVCEDPFRRKRETQRFGSGHTVCKKEYRRFSRVYDYPYEQSGYGGSADVIYPLKTSIKPGIKSGLEAGISVEPSFWLDQDGRGWWWEADQDVEHRLFNRAGELVARLNHRGDRWVLTWPRTIPEQSAGDLETAKRLGITIALANLPDSTTRRLTLPEADAGDFLEHEWYEVVSSDGVVCEVRGRALDIVVDLLVQIDDAPALVPDATVEVGEGWLDIPEFLRRE